MFRKTVLMGAVLAAGVGAGIAQAATVGFALDIDMANANGPGFTITNLSDTASITGGSLTLGDTSYNFDCVTQVAAPSGGAVTVLTPEVNACFPGGGQRPDTIEFTTSGFDPGDAVSFYADVDPDFRDGTVSDPGIVTDGGSLSIAFSGSQSVFALAVDLTNPGVAPYGYVVTAEDDSGGLPPVPLPASGLLLFGGLASVGLIRRRR